MRRAASKLGLCFAEKIGGSRRPMSSEPEKRLYLCFVETAGSYTNQVVRSVRFNSDDDDETDEELSPPEVAYSRSSKVYNSWSLTTRFGSQIVIPTGTHDRITHFRLVEFPPNSKKEKLYRFSSSKNDPWLGELNGKLYCIDGLKKSGFLDTPKKRGKSKSIRYRRGHDPYLSIANELSLLQRKHRKKDLWGDDTVVKAKLLRNSKLAENLDRKVQPFEFLDTENKNNFKWRPLDPPPFINGSSPNDFVFSFLGWECDKIGVYCFDTTNPENGWTESSSSLDNTLPFHVWNRRRPLFVRDHHPVLGDFHLMFKYDPERSLIKSSFLSAYCDYFEIMECAHLHFPEFYNDLDSKLPISPNDFEFVHLGDQKVCFVLNKFFPHDHDPLKNTGILIVITFKYEFNPQIFNSLSVKFHKPILSISHHLLSKRCFRYHSGQLHKQGCTKTDSVRMTGVFLL